MLFKLKTEIKAWFGFENSRERLFIVLLYETVAGFSLTAGVAASTDYEEAPHL